MSQKEQIVIYGSGAIGRGFLAPIFDKLGYRINFVDKNPLLINSLKSRNIYRTAFSNHNNYNIIKVRYENAFLLGDEDKILNSTDIVFSCVGPNNISDFAYKLRNVRRIISFENDRESAEKIRKMSGNENCYFGIPDVITSNDRPDSLKKIDPLCLVSEYGDIVIEKGNFYFPEKIKECSREELEKYWNCKFYLHNTPHAAAAFLGKLFGKKYVHESTKIPIINSIVGSVMESTKNAMKLKGMAEDDFIDYYAKKEVERFRDLRLFDPIERVARDPIRKLRNNDRLMGSAKIMQETNQNMEAMLIVIDVVIQDALINYSKQLLDILHERPSKYLILKRICGLEENNPLFKKILDQNSDSLLPSHHSTHAGHVGHGGF